ncbi:amino acid permease [Streptomyces sp. NPDC090306]|uniref:amino acid permease n=1 Tax=Streptomyces sp. NPDC090306 TaxID=3365961 RepID=UPI0038269E20
MESSGAPLSVARATALCTGALLGPSLLLLPGLAYRVAGPASILSWAGLLVLSGLIALVFARLGTAAGSAAGAAGYARAGLGDRAGRATAWCFFAGAVTGAPVVCLIGGAYVAETLGLTGRGATVLSAAALLTVVLVLRLRGAGSGAKLQLVLMAVLVALVAVAVLGSLPSVRAAHWHPFLSHGGRAPWHAAGLLMLAFTGWEAAAPLIPRLRSPRRDLPKVIATSFVLTAVLYLALAAATIAVLGAQASGAAPLAGLMSAALGTPGTWTAGIVAVVVTVGCVNAYLQGATTMAAALAPGGGAGRQRLLTWTVTGCGALLLACTGAGFLGTTSLVAVPTSLFLCVYVVALASGTRLLTGPVRRIAGLASLVAAALLATTGWAGLAAAAVACAGAVLTGGRRSRAAGGWTSALSAEDRTAARTEARETPEVRAAGRVVEARAVREASETREREPEPEPCGTQLG